MELIPILQDLGTQRCYLELLRDDPKITTSRLQKCESALTNIESTVEQMICTPLPPASSAIKFCISSVMQNIARMEEAIEAAREPVAERGLVDEKLRLQMGVTCLEVLQFQLHTLIDALTVTMAETTEETTTTTEATSEWVH